MYSEDKIANLKGYLKTIVFTDDVICAKVTVPEKWSVPASIDQLNVATKQINGQDYYFLTEFSNGSECILDAIEFVVSMNQDIDKKAKLFEEKVAELRSIFEREKFEKLKQIDFIFKKAKKGKKNTVEKEKAVEKEMDNNTETGITT